MSVYIETTLLRITHASAQMKTHVHCDKYLYIHIHTYYIYIYVHTIRTYDIFSSKKKICLHTYLPWKLTNGPTFWHKQPVDRYDMIWPRIWGSKGADCPRTSHPRSKDHTQKRQCLGFWLILGLDHESRPQYLSLSVPKTKLWSGSWPSSFSCCSQHTIYQVDDSADWCVIRSFQRNVLSRETKSQVFSAQKWQSFAKKKKLEHPVFRGFTQNTKV